MRVVKIVLACLVAAPVGIGIHYLVREHRASSAYDRARLGQDEASVVKQLGPPDQVLDCGQYLWWNGDQANPQKNEGQCKKWVRYNFFLHAFAFGYSSDSKLVSRYEYSSE
jgi:hypothetical protein